MTKNEVIIILVLTILIQIAGIIFLSIRLQNLSLPPEPSSQDIITGTVALPPGLIPNAAESLNKVEITLTMPEKKNTGSSNLGITQFSTIILTGIFTLLGSISVLIYNYIASRATRKFDWGKFVWDKYHASYLDLRDAIATTTQANVLRAKLEALKNKVFIPNQIHEKLTQLLTVYDSATEEAVKQQKAKDVIVAIDDFILHPWNYL